MFKGVALMAVLLFAGGYFLGAFGPQAYSRTVSRPPAAVMAALEDLDLTAQPGAPGSTAEAAGGIKPLFRLVKGADRMTWYVMSGDKVATAMTALFEPVDGGKATRIRTNVERGNAPDDFVSPAFRSKGLTMAQVNKLVAPAAASAETCQKLLDGFRDSNIAALPQAGPVDFREGMANGAKTIIRLNAMEAELRRNGCNTNGNDGPFRSVEQHMAPAESGNGMAADDLPAGMATTRPDAPMLDPKPSR